MNILRRTNSAPRTNGQMRPIRWPLFLLSLPALVTIWSGWVGIGEMAGFGPVKVLPGISDFTINTAITLPVGLETYAAYSMYAWLTAVGLTHGTRRFAMWSAFGSLALGMAGQISYHLLVVAGVKMNAAPVAVVIGVSSIPVLVVGFGIGLAHAMHKDHSDRYATETAEEPVPAPVSEVVVTGDLETIQGLVQTLSVPAPRKRMEPVSDWATTDERYLKGVDLYTKSLEGPGRPLSQRDLSTAIGLKNRELARKIISDVKASKEVSTREVNHALPSET